MGAPRHDPETIELALTTLALAGDSPTKAAAVLADGGIRVSRRVIAGWRDKFPDRYAHIRDVRAREIERSVVHKARALAEQYSDLEQELITEIRAQMAAGTLKDASTTLRNIAVSKGIAIDKMLVVDGRPNQIAEHRSVDDDLRELARMGFVDTTATEEPAALGQSHNDVEVATTTLLMRDEATIRRTPC
jgi:hypothetical protein